MISKYRILSLAMAAGFAVATAPASAQMVEAKNPASIVDALKEAGLPAELKKDGAGDPLIVTNLEKRKVAIVFYGCQNNVNCSYVSFYFGLTYAADDKRLTATQIADWNEKRRFGRLARQGDTGVTLQQEVALAKGGMSRALFIDNLSWFSAAVTTVVMILTAD